MKTSKKIGEEIGKMIAGLEARILGWLGTHISANPHAYGAWLAEHGFARHEPNNPNAVVDYAGFGRWLRTWFIYVPLALMTCSKLYTPVIGTLNEDERTLIGSVAVGVLLFGGAGIYWLYRSVYRVNHELAWLLGITSLFLTGVLVGLPLWQYHNVHDLPTLTKAEIQGYIAAGIPRLWNIYTTLPLLAFTVALILMVRLIPAILALAFTKAKEGFESVIEDIAKLLRTDSESDEAAKRLRQKSDMQGSIILTICSILVLVSCSLQLSPTVWGPYGAIILGMLSLVVYWMRVTIRPRGKFLTKALYGVGVGALMYSAFKFGLIVYVLGMFSTMSQNHPLYRVATSTHPLFTIEIFSFVLGLVSAIAVMLTTTLEEEQQARASGDGTIDNYTQQYKGKGTDGQPQFEIVSPKPMSFTWLRSWTLWIPVAVIALVAYLRFYGNPLSGLSPVIAAPSSGNAFGFFSTAEGAATLVFIAVVGLCIVGRK